MSLVWCCKWWQLCTWHYSEGWSWFNEPDAAHLDCTDRSDSPVLGLIVLFVFLSQASDVTAEIKRKLEKKKKRKKRDKKLLELQSNGDANGDSEVIIFVCVRPSMLIWDLTQSNGPFSVYHMQNYLNSEPLAGPISGPDHWRESNI